ncbi:hypothetical protein FHG64_12740 [Antarcticibacterium flavum]|uniref:DUF6602 domain-containing protein n=1 Tax=Antarcticibacterium flavum TaxID=2058175 RepID=A0A5B7X673_9FLAO|nr:MULTISPECIES: DUF6602 domain-containing protein [Antarcticibacterium]MCM4158445.1 hypothetical protein [Antarcticibacterium sp. W02-3]QCY70201.1 hypothetical protein FHG64_12740 [Antarcticibacterium flavum]
MNKIDLKSLFEGLQKQMISQLSTNRDFITHPGSKGDSLENAWIEWLQKYLPNRYSVDKAIVIDSNGNTSQQIDIVIYDNWFTPFIFSQNGFHYIPAEGVYAIFEVKPDVSGSSEGVNNIEYAAEKIESVRKLKRTTTSIISVGQKQSPRGLTKIVGGILTSTKSGSKTSNETLKKHLKAQSGLKSIDFGCIADYGSFFVDYKGEENPDITDIENRYMDFYSKRIIKEIHFSKSENSLVTFFLQLTRYLQQSIGTVAAIDLQAYSNAIDEEIDREI